MIMNLICYNKLALTPSYNHNVPGAKQILDTLCKIAGRLEGQIRKFPETSSYFSIEPFYINRIQPKSDEHFSIPINNILEQMGLSDDESFHRYFENSSQYTGSYDRDLITRVEMGPILDRVTIQDDSLLELPDDAKVRKVDIELFYCFDYHNFHGRNFSKNDLELKLLQGDWIPDYFAPFLAEVWSYLKKTKGQREYNEVQDDIIGFMKDLGMRTISGDFTPDSKIRKFDLHEYGGRLFRRMMHNEDHFDTHKVSLLFGTFYFPENMTQERITPYAYKIFGSGNGDGANRLGNDNNRLFLPKTL